MKYNNEFSKYNSSTPFEREDTMNNTLNKLLSPELIIFHRAKCNIDEDLINQQAYLQTNFTVTPKIIDYVSGEKLKAQEIVQVINSAINSSIKVKVIMNSFLEKKAYDTEYDQYNFFKGLKEMGLISLCLMDCEGTVYNSEK